MSDILDRLLGQPHTTSEPPEVTAQREALMADVALEIRRLRQIVGERDAIKALATQMRAALDAYDASQEKAEAQAEKDAAAAAKKAEQDAKKAEKAEEAQHTSQQHPQQTQNQPHR
jgi:hypothetical protein